MTEAEHRTTTAHAAWRSYMRLTDARVGDEYRNRDSFLPQDVRWALDEIDRLRVIEAAAQVAVHSHGHDTEYAAMEALERALNAPSQEGHDD